MVGNEGKYEINGKLDFLWSKIMWDCLVNNNEAGS